MNTRRVREITVCGVILAAYNVVVFAVPFKKNSLFAISYAFAMISIIVFSASYFFAFEKSKTLKSTVFGFPIFRAGFTYLVVQLAVSSALMLLSSLFTISNWIAIVPSVLLLAAAIIKITAVDAAREKIADVGVRQEISTEFMRGLQAGLQTLAERVSDERAAAKLFKLYEAAKYSDPVSKVTLAEIEARLSKAFEDIKAAVGAGDNDLEPLIDEFSNLLSERNRLCKLSK